MPFAFTHAVLLAALGGLALPFALHLLMRRRQVRMQFSTVRFFDPQDPRAKARRRLRNLLLLLLRVACFTLVVLAFARPFLPLPSINGGKPRQIVLVLDRSLSLQARDATGSRWDQAVTAARAALASLGPGDRAAIIGLGSRAEVLLPFAPPGAAAARLSDLRPTHTSSDLAEGLREAIRLTRGTARGIDSSIELISDFQANATDTLPSVALPSDVTVHVRSVGDRAPFNAAITDLQLDPGETNRPFAIITTYGDDPATSTPVEFRIDGAPVWRRSISLPPGQSIRVELDLPSLAPGWHEADLTLDTRDALAADNHRSATLLVRTPVRVLLVEGRRGVRSFREQTFFLSAALDPHAGQTAARPGRFLVQSCTPEQLAPTLAAANGNSTEQPGTQTSVDALLLPAQRTWPNEAIVAVESFVRSGGGAALFVGDDVPAAAFNSALGEFSPAQLLQPEGAEPETPWRIAFADRGSAVFDAFRHANSGNLAIAEFTRRFSLQPANDATVLARFDDGAPCVIRRKWGRGRVLLINTTPDTAWSDWPKHKTFVPSIHGIARHLARRDDDRPFVVPASFAAGSEAILAPVTPASGALSLVLPDATRTNVLLNPIGECLLDATLPGVHRLLGASNSESLRFAVHTPNAESDLTGITVKQVERRIVHQETSAAEPVGADLFGSDSGQRELWRLLLVSAIGLLLVETLVANRTTP